MYFPAVVAGTDQMRSTVSPCASVATVRETQQKIREASSEPRYALNATAKSVCVRAPRFPTVTMTSTLPPTATQQARSIPSATRSSTISLERSATITVPEGPMFRTFQPVPWLR